MSTLLNTLFVTTPGSYLHLDHETVRVEQDGHTVKRVPLNHIMGVTVFGNVLVSPQLMGKLAETGRSLVFLSSGGRFCSRISGPVNGNVLLRQAQYRALDNTAACCRIAGCFVAGKIQNCRQVLLRGARETDDAEPKQCLKDAANAHAQALPRLETTSSLDEIRGIEGMTAKAYFDAFQCLIRIADASFVFDGRNRRPPRDRINALLSFLYTLLRSDCTAALEGVGLDPQAGYLHALRPGRPALALDLMEELRPLLADRVALSLINRKQLATGDFEEQAGGAVWLSESGRRQAIIEYQQRKQSEVTHPVLGHKLAWGLVPHAQARLLARHLRGEIPFYPAFIGK